MPSRDVVVIGASASSFTALQGLLARLPAGLPASVLVVVHMPAVSTTPVATMLGGSGPLPVAFGVPGQRLTPGLVTVAPPDQHMVVTPGDVLRLHRGPQVHLGRPAIDPLMTSAAQVCGARVIAVVLGGPLPDAAVGAAAVAAAGGTVLVQDPADTRASDMPRAALERVPQAMVWSASKLGPAVADLVLSTARRPRAAVASSRVAPVEGIDEALWLAISRLQEHAAAKQRLHRQLQPTSRVFERTQAEAAEAIQAAELITTHVLPAFTAAHGEPPGHTDAKPAYPLYVSRVVEAIQAHPERVFTTTVLADLAGVSVRLLQKSFERHLGMSPTAYLRQVRLARVHAELLDADPAAVTVAEVANRWGFAHLGRFSAAYRTRYGMPPSHTLRTSGP